MGSSSSKPKHELRSCRVAYQEHLQTSTTTTRKEKAKSSGSTKRFDMKDSKPKDKRVTGLAADTKDSESFSGWSGETVYGDGKEGRH